MPDVVGLTMKEAKGILKDYEIGEIYILGEGEKIKEQFPIAGEVIEINSDLIMYLE